MLHQIRGLHHVTALASAPRCNNAFYTGTLGLRRVKKTVNFDRPDVYHLYFGDAEGRPGTVMTSFPFSGAARGTPGTGEVSLTTFSVPPDSLGDWAARLGSLPGFARDHLFGAERLLFEGPDGDRLALTGLKDDRAPWTGGLPAGMAIRGFATVALCLNDIAPTADLLRLMGYAEQGRDGGVVRFALPGGGPTRVIDLHARPDLPRAREGAGSVHHIAFGVDNRARQFEVADALADAGFNVTAPRDRTYFRSVYFRSPGGILFEVATAEPGFAVDEPCDGLGTRLKLPGQHEHLRARLERALEPLEG